jgi:cystathionine beta-lyase/cystathionine gamma-synthase
VPRPQKKMETLAVHAGERRPGPEGSVVYPIYQGTVFTVEPGASYHDIRYLRLSSTPSQTYLHERLAALEGAEAALATSSGMTAVTSALIALLSPGDHLLAADCLYGGTHDFLTQDAPKHGWSVTAIDVTRPETWDAAKRAETKVLLVETIANPLMRVPRLTELAAFARRNGITTLIDNTFASPVNFNPLASGYDLVFHSATKYLNGHSDIVAGCLMGPKELVDRVRRVVNHYGGSLDPHAGFLLIRGTKTLALRVKAQNAGAQALAHALAAHPQVAVVNYAGLPGHPDHEHARGLLRGFSGMLSFRIRGGEPATLRFLEALVIPHVAPSLGGVETLVTRPVTTSHAGMSPEDRAKMGITDDLVRVSVGIEDPDDLVADFAQALDRA